MKYKVISLYCIGRVRKFKKGDIVSAGDFVSAEEKVKQGFLVAVGEDSEVTAPTIAEVIGEARMADGGGSTIIAPTIPAENAEPEVEQSKPGIKEVNNDPSEDLKIKPAPSTGSKKELKEL